MAGEEVVCGKVIKYSEVEATPVPREMATGTTIRWLISKEDGAKHFYMRLFEMEPGAHIKPHYHPWEHEIFILEGGGEVRIGQRVFKVEADHVVFIPPNVEHEYKAGESGMKFLCIIPAAPTAEEVAEPIACK